MGFFTGRVTFARYRISGPNPGQFGPAHLERLAAHAAGKQRQVAGDGVEVGWTGGDHILDTEFDLARNIVDDTLHFAFRVDSQKIPGDLLRAYFLSDLKALAAANPSGLPSARQKKEARQSARDRLDEEARDGRYLKRKAYPLLWDARSNELLVGTTAVTVIDRLHTFFQQTFGFGFEPLGAGQLAFHLAELRQQTRDVDDATPSVFVPGVSPPDLAWMIDEHSRDFLGNEFFVWLWFMLDSDHDTIPLPDGTEAAVMLARTLLLECPRGQSGKETISSEMPTRLPEARRALQSGKLPRKVGMTVVRHDAQYEWTLHAETLAVGAARLPAPEATEERARLEERLAQIRHLIETQDLLFDAFIKVRTSETWSRDLGRIQKWLQREDPRRLAAIS